MTEGKRYGFSPLHSSTIAVICGDGRLAATALAFLAEQGEPKPDLLALPGGALALARSAETFQDRLYALKRLRTLIEAHRSQRLVLMAHTGDTDEAQCALARLMHPGDTPQATGEWVVKRLTEAMQDAKAEFPGVDVQAYLALAEGDGVSFVPVGV